MVEAPEQPQSSDRMVRGEQIPWQHQDFHPPPPGDSASQQTRPRHHAGLHWHIQPHHWIIFGVPMLVQTMKSVAAMAITEGDPLTVPQIMATRIITAALLLFLSTTGLMNLVQRYVPLPIMRGIQLSQGISFRSTAVKYILKNQDFSTSKSTTARPWLGVDRLLLAIGIILAD
ncbi:unnamed protein product [Calypogeia fissa]